MRKFNQRALVCVQVFCGRGRHYCNAARPVEFGIGKDRDVLYITVDTSLYRIRLKTRGWHVQYQGRKKKL